MKIGVLCIRQVVIVRPETTVLEAARLMREHHVGSLVVVDPSTDPPRPVNMVTDRDLTLEALALAGDRGPSLQLRSILAERRLVSAREDEDLEEVLERMRGQGVRRLPVVDVRGRLVGIFAFDDAIDWLAEQVAGLARLLKREQEREVRDRP